VIDSLVGCFGPEAAHPFDIVEQDWTVEEFTRGCYGGRLGAGVWTQHGKALAAPVGRIHWAASETSDIWNGTWRARSAPAACRRRDPGRARLSPSGCGPPGSSGQ
jgi:monoamine oxidase